jgi:phosphatidylglycerol:prolipoprotein diacylglycerol transferase
VYPDIQLGPMTFGTFGIMTAVAFLCAWQALKLNMRRHNLLKPRAELVAMLLAISGLIGSKLYCLLETPAQFASLSVALDLTQGRAWFGSLLAGTAVLYLLARLHNLSPLRMMDIVSPTAVVAYAIGRLGCLLSGDGCYGVPTTLPWGMTFPHGLSPTNDYVHPTPIYEFIASALIFIYLWRIPARTKASGWVFANYLLLTGSARFLVEFIRINPQVSYGLTNAQLMSILCLIAGILIYMFILKSTAQPSAAGSFSKHSEN